MTIPAARFFVRASREDDASHWFEIILSLIEKTDKESVYYFGSTYRCEITSLDEESSDYTSENWESGIYSGVRYALADRRDLRVVIHTFRGSLSSADLQHVARIASNLVAKGLQNGRISPITGWLFREATLPGTA
jgi:hypothetical protein